MDHDSASPRRTQTDYLDGGKLRSLREAAGLSQGKLALATDNKQGRIAHWEAGDDGCGIEVIALLAAELGCQPEELMHEAGIARYRALMKALKPKRAAKRPAQQDAAAA